MNGAWSHIRSLGASVWPQAWTRRESIPVRLGRAPSDNMQAPVRLQSFDQVLVWVTVALLVWGLVMVYSATIALPDNPKFARYAHTHFLVRHL
ncbi:MAG: cell division protein FtsW, partial [Burkholderiaceae bacterium]